MKVTSLLVVGLAAAAMSAAGLAQDAAPHKMTKERFEQYLGLFNAADERYAQFYDENVVFHHAPMFGVLKGRQAIIDFYRNIRTQISEQVTPHTVVVDNEQGMMAAELSTRLVAIKDGVAMPSGDLNTGDTIISEGTVYYTLKDGLIVTIRGSIDGAKRIPAASPAP